MLRCLSLTAALIALSATVAAAQDYSDTANNFRVSVPDDWTSATPKNEAVKYQIVSPRAATTRGNCTVIAMLMPETRGVTQADLEADAERTFDAASIQDGLKKAQYVTDATVVSTGAKMINGHKGFFVVADLTGDIPEQGVVKARVQQMLEFIPGQMFVVTCTASDSGYAQEESDFNIVFNSFAPLSEAPVAALPSLGVSSLTMYSAPGYGGVSRVVTQDAPSLAMFGWRAPAGSVSIAGSGAWEVCDGADFSGRCHMITTSLATGPTGKGFIIASARHVKAILPPQAGRIDVRAALSASIESAFGR